MRNSLVHRRFCMQVFEKDPVKYVNYEEAVYQALCDGQAADPKYIEKPICIMVRWSHGRQQVGEKLSKLEQVGASKSKLEPERQQPSQTVPPRCATVWWRSGLRSVVADWWWLSNREPCKPCEPLPPGGGLGGRMDGGGKTVQCSA